MKKNRREGVQRERQREKREMKERIEGKEKDCIRRVMAEEKIMRDALNVANQATLLRSATRVDQCLDHKRMLPTTRKRQRTTLKSL